MSDPSITAVNKRLLAMISRAEPSQKLSMLKGIIKTQHHQVQQHARETVEAAAGLGAMLVEARKLVRHGQWEKWVTANCEFTPRYANDLIKLSVYFQGLAEANRKLTSDLTVTAAIAMARQKADPAKFDAEAFAAVAKDAPPEDTDDAPPWTGAEESPTVAPAPPLPEQSCMERIDTPPATSLVVVEEPAVIPPPPEPKAIEGEYIPGAPTAPPEAKPHPGRVIESEGNPLGRLQTKEQLLREARKLLGKASDGKPIDPVDVLAWVVAYDTIKMDL